MKRFEVCENPMDYTLTNTREIVFISLTVAKTD